MFAGKKGQATITLSFAALTGEALANPSSWTPEQYHISSANDRKHGCLVERRFTVAENDDDGYKTFNIDVRDATGKKRIDGLISSYLNEFEGEDEAAIARRLVTALTSAEITGKERAL